MPPKTASTKPNAAAETARKLREGEEGLFKHGSLLMERFGTMGASHHYQNPHLQSTAELLNEMNVVGASE